MLGVIMLLAMVFDISERLSEFIKNEAPISGIFLEYYLNFIILIGEFDYYGQFGFERNANVYFSLNVRKEKILLKKLSEQYNTFSGKIELY